MIEWIKTSDRIPEQSDLQPHEIREGYIVYQQIFLCYTNCGSVVLAKFVMPPKKDGTYYRGYFQNWNPEEITHWSKLNLPEE